MPPDNPGLFNALLLVRTCSALLLVISTTAALLALPQGTEAAVAFDTVGPSAAGTGGGPNPPAAVSNPITWSHTVSATGTNRVLVVGLSLGITSGGTAAPTVAVTYGGVAMTKFARYHVDSSDSDADTAGFIELYYLVAPPRGTNSVSVSLSNIVNVNLLEVETGSISFTGVSQTNPVVRSNTARGNSAAPSITVNNTNSGNMLVDILGSGTDITGVGGSQNNRWLKNIDSQSTAGNGAQSTKTGGGTATLSYTTANDKWAIIALELNSATTLSKPPNNLGLVGYWSFNEGTSTTATDFSGNRNTGTLTTNGGSLPTWTNGKLGKALSIASVDQSYVNVSSNNTLTISGSHTISAWVRPTAIPSSGEFSTIAGKYGTLNNVNYALFLDNAALSAGDGIGFIFYNDGTCWAKFSSTPQIGRWYHLVGVFDTNATTMTLYVNGVQQAQSGTCSLPTGTGEFWIGRDRGTSLGYWDGTIDEVRVYNRALSASEVAKLYQSGALKINASSADLDNGSSLENGLVAHWTFDGKDLTDKVYDVSGQGNHGVITTSDGSAHTATTSMKVLGKLGQALRFVDFGGGDGDVVDIPNSGSVADNLTNMSIGVWFKAPVGAGNNMFVTKLNIGPFRGWSFGVVSAGHIEFQTSQDDTNYHGSITTSTYDDNQWHYAVAALSGGANGTITIYVDGASQSAVSDDSGAPSSYSAPHDIWMGNHILGADFNGPLDDIRIYNRALSPAEVQQLYKLGTVIIRP
jgi:hypothetical protein